MAKKKTVYIEDRRFKFTAPGASHWSGAHELDLDLYCQGVFETHPEVMLNGVKHEAFEMTAMALPGVSLLTKLKAEKKPKAK